MNKSSCKCNKCELKNTSDCPIKQFERMIVEQGREMQIKNPDIFIGADGLEYYWDGPMAMYKPTGRMI